jgi:hypothetical protein
VPFAPITKKGVDREDTRRSLCATPPQYKQQESRQTCGSAISSRPKMISESARRFWLAVFAFVVARVSVNK